MIRIRLKRVGTKNKPFFQIIIIDKRNSNNGKFIERIGYFNPINKYNYNYINLCEKRIKYWKNLGANISYRVKKIIKIFKKNYINK
ncbi:MAG: 30S ribosomal protein S16 [Enterobacteriaceae bacterium PSpicST2]|nr:MAG: 30S ribosomal protein S16 [Enterobacteriaceae bacterium PSpicST2]WMC19156.1 MAG: 30S ribosomal protein S16 [Enterobacteriaceae bacterium PSpicST1]